MDVLRALLVEAEVEHEHLVPGEHGRVVRRAPVSCEQPVEGRRGDQALEADLALGGARDAPLEIDGDERLVERDAAPARTSLASAFTYSIAPPSGYVNVAL